MNTLISNETGRLNELPADLRAWLPEGRLLEVALEAVEVVTSQDAALRGKRFEQFSPAMMLTLLTYCYSTDSFGSEDVQWAAINETTPRYICRLSIPDAQAIRRFRRAYRSWVVKCLVYVLNRAVAEQPTQESFDTMYAETFLDAEAWARRKIDLAILMDTAAAD
jgi:transposase